MVTIRPELPDDAAAIHQLHKGAFAGDAEAQLVNALRAAGRLYLSLVADQDEEIVGHVAFSPVRLEGAAAVTGGVGLAPLAVAAAVRRQGIGAQLVREGLADCVRAGYGFVVVLGSPAYYGRFGFAPASRWGLADEYQGGAAFQALELRPGAIPAGARLVRYAPEFAPFAP
jgi:putative acetyltransferase